MLERVGTEGVEAALDRYPHQFSSGMRQRMMIASLMLLEPALLIADEPTTALDVSVQAQILELIARLQQEENLAVLMISHDLGVVAGYADEVAVMYAGKIVEQADVDTLFAAPTHPYTAGLMRAAPRLTKQRNPERLVEIPGTVPALGARGGGCSFSTRCASAIPACTQSVPELLEVAPEHRVACLLQRPAR